MVAGSNCGRDRRYYILLEMNKKLAKFWKNNKNWLLVTLAVAVVAYWRKAKLTHFADFVSEARPGNRNRLGFGTKEFPYYFAIVNGDRTPNPRDEQNNTSNWKGAIIPWKNYKKRKYLW